MYFFYFTVETVVFLLLTLFVPGISGLISVIVATYILYGLYQVALDLDVTVADKGRRLMNANIQELKDLRYTLFHEEMFKEISETGDLIEIEIDSHNTLCLS